MLDDLNARLERLRDDVPLSPLPLSTQTRAAAERVRRHRRAAGAVVAVACLGAVSLTAVSNGSQSLRTPADPSVGSPAVTHDPQHPPVDLLLPADLPSRFGKWQFAAYVPAAPGGAVACDLTPRAATQFGLSAAYGTVLHAEDGAGNQAVAQWTVVQAEDWSDAQPEKTVAAALDTCAGHSGGSTIEYAGPADGATATLQSARWTTADVRSTALVRMVGKDTVVTIIDVPKSVPQLTDQEAERLAVAAVARYNEDEKRRARREAAASERLQSELTGRTS